ncbi:MAG: alpha-galactosidase [Pirellulales bacterium]|nr:alpha-galactosidase [Pirellulales bacterium]
MKLLLLLAFVGHLSAAAVALGQTAAFVLEAEVNAAHRWFEESFGADGSKVPFSFNLGDESSADVLKRSQVDARTENVDGNRIRRSITWADPKTGLETKVVAVQYADYPSIEWTAYFKNAGANDTPVIADIQAIDVSQAIPAEASTILHHMKGSRAAPNDFEPYEMGLVMRTKVTFRSAGGRSTNGCWPYFNVNWQGHGLIVAMGWPGQWSTTLERDGGGGLVIRGGQENVRFKLHPGETARTPLMVLQLYEGDWIRGQNVWRRWMVNHNVPRQDGELAPAQLVACSSHQFGEMIRANEENQKHFIDRYLEEEFPLAYWWMDAGWYVNDGAWATTGTWEVDKQRFPNGLRAITDHAHAKGVKAIVWFEPERVAPGTWLYEERPQWLLSAPANPGDQLYDPRWRLLNLGNDEARQWLIQHINGLIKSEGIDLYRQDFNVDPVLFWRNGEAEDRQGITENHYVTGYLAYWDALLKANPGLRIDTCASGGRRLDLETLRRSVPLLRSDFLLEPTAQQVQTYGLSLWVPYHGTATLVGKSAIGQSTRDDVSEYDFRSHMASSVNACWDVSDKSLDYDALRRLTGELAAIAPFYQADYYPLTRHTLSPDEWIAWQFNRPDTGEAMVQAFRRQDNAEPEKYLKLAGLDRTAQYQIQLLGADETWSESGATLMDRGLKAMLPEKRSAGSYLLSKAEASTANAAFHHHAHDGRPRELAAGRRGGSGQPTGGVD